MTISETLFNATQELLRYHQPCDAELEEIVAEMVLCLEGLPGYADVKATPWNENPPEPVAILSTVVTAIDDHVDPAIPDYAEARARFDPVKAKMVAWIAKHTAPDERHIG